MKRFFLPCFLAASVLTMNACSDDDDPQPQNFDKHSYKFTVTAEGLGEDETAGFTIFGVTENPQESTFWKVDGQVRNNEQSVRIDDFPSKRTYVIESTIPLINAGVDIGCQNFDDTPIKFTFKAEVDGKVAKEDSQTIAGFGTQYNQDYKF
ncbi:hypothetical protein RYH73_06900 [Olivibacter sp. CPCC 100613]|uniref:hypothetical protein n=1 Tax=Olivibacter sp. CPCC 100613 TaxID=3079931 RepID=UPI002FF46EB0